MIGVFDSGIGGLTVARALRRKLPELALCYLGDTARTPYGNKSPETIRRYAEEAARFLLEKGAKAVVIACNTASSLATDHLRETFPGTPIFEVITPAVDAALVATKNGRVGVIGTRATVASGVYEQRLRAARPDIHVFSRPAPLLVALAEEGWFDAPETASIVGKYVAPIRDEKVDALILGCTHYPMLKKVIAERMGESVRLIDSAEAAAEAFCATLEEDRALKDSLKKGASSYFATDPNPTFSSVASEWLGEPVSIQKADISP